MVECLIYTQYTHSYMQTYRQTENFILLLLLKINGSVSLTKWLTLTLRIPTLIHAYIQSDRKLHSVTVTKNKRFSLIDQMVDFDVKNTHTHTCRHTYRQTENFILLLKINCSVSLTKWLTLTLRILTLM